MVMKVLTNERLIEEVATVDSARVAGAQTLRKGLSLLDLIADADSPLRFKDLADKATLPNGTLHRQLQSLMDYRLVRFDEPTATYRLGARVFEMAHKVWNEFDIVSGAVPELERLSEIARETARLGVLENGRVLILEQRETIQPVRLSQGIGTRIAPHATALGKAMLAYLPEMALDAMLDAGELRSLTAQTITDREAFKRELGLAKGRGYAIALEEQNEGINAVAAAILDHQGKPIGAISVTGPAYRLGEQQLHLLGRDVIKSARRISGNIGEAAMSINSDPKPRTSPEIESHCVVNIEPLLGEGPVWLPQANKLLWVDILAPAIMLTEPETGDTSRFDIDELTGVVVPRRRGGFLAATQSGIYGYDLISGKGALIAQPELPNSGNRFNDGKCDSKGRFWAGTFAIDASPGRGSLYCLEPSGAIRRVASGFHISNGLGWSPDDRTFYFSDSGERVIYAYDFDVESGEIANQRIFASNSDGEARPDGLAVDAEGYVWSAHWDGWSVVRYDPDGKIDRVVPVPVPRPTSCAFGGTDLSTLFVTSARVRLSAMQLEEAPLSGSLFKLDVGVRGVPTGSFAG